MVNFLRKIAVASICIQDIHDDHDEPQLQYQLLLMIPCASIRHFETFIRYCGIIKDTLVLYSKPKTKYQ